jgi:hypothetical protein
MLFIINSVQIKYQMKDIKPIHNCKSCGFSGTENYCSRCGQSFMTKRISLKTLLQDIFHFFTYLDKGFGYTLKQLIIAPGNMQRSYIEGDRIKHQKPFAMFFICATFYAFIRYWIFNTLIKYYHADIISETRFVHEYIVLTFIILLPVYVIITYLFFYNSGYNYAEIGVLMLYILSVFFLIATFTSLLKLIWPQMDTAYIEFPIFIFYFIITLTNYFKKLPVWKVIVKSLLAISILLFINEMTEHFVIRLIS